MSHTSRLGLPYIAAAQAQKHVTHNEALDRLDALVNLKLESCTLSTPPAVPVEGQAFAVPPTPAPVGAWAGHGGHIALFREGGWLFVALQAGFLAFVANEGELRVFDGTTWQSATGSIDPVLQLTRLGLGTAPHATAPLVLEGNEAILSAPPAGANTGSDCRLTLNRTSGTSTATLVFKTQWQGRAEIGLAGSDDFSLKVNDGTTWRTALTANRANGNLAVANHLVVGEASPTSNGITIAKPIPTITLKDTAGEGVNHLSFVSFFDKNGAEKVWCGLGSSSNTEFTFLSHYPDGINFYAFGGNHPIQFTQAGQQRIRVHTNGYIGIRETAPTAPLHVNGGARVGTYAKAQLPAAATLGAGTIVYVSDDAAGATLAFSDGTTWRRAHDRQPVA